MAVYAPANGAAILRKLPPAAGHDNVLLVNGDSPTLPPRLLLQAIDAPRGSGCANNPVAGTKAALVMALTFLRLAVRLRRECKS